MNRHHRAFLSLVSFIVFSFTTPGLSDEDPSKQNSTDGPPNEAETRPAKAMTATELFAKASPAVVRIIVYGKKANPTAFGSGFFVSPDGLVVTNYHVVEGASSVSVLLTSNAKFDARIIATKPKADLALLETKAVGVPFLRLEGKDPEVGAKVYAIGNPRGLKNTISEGIISGFRKYKKRSVLQTTAPISTGSSGGPLLTLTGRVIGVTTFTIIDGQNLNFVMSRKSISELIQQERKPVTTQPSLLKDNKHYPSLAAIFDEAPKELFPEKKLIQSRLSWSQLQIDLFNKWLADNVNFRPGSFSFLSISGKFHKAAVEENIAFIKLHDEFIQIKRLGGYCSLWVLAGIDEASMPIMSRLRNGEPVRLKGVIGHLKLSHQMYKRTKRKAVVKIHVTLGACALSKVQAKAKSRKPQKDTDSPKTPVPSSEKKAKAKLSLARMYLQGGMKEKARSILKSILTDYPGTPSAPEARKELEKME